jgi:hypothetical protein
MMAVRRVLDDAPLAARVLLPSGAPPLASRASP